MKKRRVWWPASASSRPLCVRTYTYQAPQYFLTGADGPWGTRDWTYDRIGNTSDTRDGGIPDTYQYQLNGGSGNTPILYLINLGVGGTRDYTWGPAGHLEEVAAGANVLDFGADAEGRLSGVDRTAASEAASFSYDGRSFLQAAQETAGGTRSVDPLYDSGGLVHALLRRPSPTDPEEFVVFVYLAGRPVVQLAIDSAGAESWTYLSTDHLGTPLLATADTGTVVWEGGFEPFGTDYQAGTMAGALDSGIFLRLPGQWDDGTWADATSGAGIYYNVWRFLEPQTGRYTRPDPLGFLPRLYRYAGSNPLTMLDTLGLYELRGRFPTHLVPDPRAYCGSSIACTIPNYSFTCYCTPGADCTWKLHGILIIGGDIYYAVGRKPYLQQTPVDPTVKGPLSAIGHEFGAHIIPSIDRVTPEIHKLERQKFPSEEACQGACLENQKRIRDLFGATMAATQAAEGNR
jgi:RHS repeat-associated protein